MRDSEVLAESPQIIPPTGFGMSDDKVRFQYTRALTSTYPQEMLEETNAYKLMKVGSGAVVTFFMLQKPDNLLVYFAKCESGKSAFLGSVATQVSLWRDNTSVTVSGITSRIFDLLIDTFGTILSDEQQTVDGQSFWIRRMAFAAASGLRVGLADMKAKTVQWRDASESYPEWIKAHENAWSPTFAAQNLRFVIAKQLSPMT